jgi:hypothetical protein
MLMALQACSSLQVKTQQDWDTDFASYRTYAWSQGVSARDPSMESQIHAAVDFELPFKGLKRVEPAGSPDLYVSTYVSVEEEQMIDSGALPAGTLMVDLVDTRSGTLVWRGRANKSVDRQVSETELRKVAREIFRYYPQKGPQKDRAP